MVIIRCENQTCSASVDVFTLAELLAYGWNPVEDRHRSKARPPRATCSRCKRVM